MPPLDRMIFNGKIDVSTFQAAQQFRADWQRACHCVGAAIAPNTRPIDAPRADTYDAAHRLRDLILNIGEHDVGLIVHVAVHEWNWCQLGRKIGCERHTARKWTMKALRRLAEYDKMQYNHGATGGCHPPIAPNHRCYMGADNGYEGTMETHSGTQGL